METKKLFNCKLDGEYSKVLLDQYKLYVEMTDRVSQRRGAANTFYITVNAAILTISSWSAENFGFLIYLISFVGVLLCVFWFLTIRSYRQLNNAKFIVIHEIEKELPLNLYSYEWEMLMKGRSLNNYWPLSHIEYYVPLAFGVFYILLSIITKISGGG